MILNSKDDCAMDNAPEPDEPANLRFLRILVTTLTGTMILGLLVIIGLFVMRFSASGPDLPDTITLPDGTTASAFTQSSDWYAVVTTDDRILIYNRSSNALIQTIQVETE